MLNVGVFLLCTMRKLAKPPGLEDFPKGGRSGFLSDFDQYFKIYCVFFRKAIFVKNECHDTG